MNKKENIIGSSWLFDNDTVSNLVNVEQTFTAKECRSISSGSRWQSIC